MLTGDKINERGPLVEEILELGGGLWPGSELLKHVRRVLFKLPMDALERIATEQPDFFAPYPTFSGRTFRNEVPIRHLVVYLSPQLLDQPQDDIEGTIAHELAHVVAQYEEVDNIRTEDARASALADEKGADVLAESWGFRVPRSIA